MSSSKLLNIQDNKLVLNDLININDAYVISIVGDARKGKSTFLNIMINFLTNENKKYFNTSSDIYHCTVGIDYIELFLNDINYIFIDCQGLNYENASHDYQYLLFLYSISNIFIYNDKNIINNNIFSTLQPMALFLNMINNNNKPILFFRIADYDLTGNCNELLDNLFLLRNDQYDNLRESIRLLFSEIKINTTEVMTKNEKKMINENKYDDMLLVENNFIIVIEEIYNLLKSQSKKNINLKLLVENINNNSKIDYNKLDIYTLNTKLEIHDFIEKYITNNNEFNEIQIDGLETTRQLIETFNENINKYNILFDKEFYSIPSDLKINFKNKIDELNKLHDKFNNKNQNITREVINKAINIILGSIIIFNKKNNNVIELKNYIIELLIEFEKENIIYNKIIYNCLYNEFIENTINIIYDEINKIKELNNIIDEINLENLKSINYSIIDIINEITSVEDSKNGDFNKFIKCKNPYDNIDDTLDNNGLIISRNNYILTFSIIKNNKKNYEKCKYIKIYTTEFYKNIELYKERIGIVNKTLLIDDVPTDQLENDNRNDLIPSLKYILIKFWSHHKSNMIKIYFEEYQFYNILKKIYDVNFVIFKYLMKDSRKLHKYNILNGKYNGPPGQISISIFFDIVTEFKIKFIKYILEYNIIDLFECDIKINYRKMTTLQNCSGYDISDSIIDINDFDIKNLIY
jgi:hypothetical protein